MACLRDNFQDGVLLDGRYETISPLNHGSFGMVFMARDIHTNETVAIKCLTKRAAADTVGFDLAIDERSEERSLHGRLGTHPNIVNLVRSFETESHLYLVLEYCDRGDLYEAIRNGHGPLETEHVRQFMLELVDAVAYMHSKGVYHRDIKPENIFLTQSGAIKLGDFGLATTENWTVETAVGSDRYMSPEQYDSAGAGYSPAQADIWAIGVCLLNALFSRNPFTTPTEADPLFLDFSRDKQSLFDVFPDMSQDTYEVIVQCMSLDPKKRSLIGARAALSRVVSFTISEEDMDDFCCDEKPVVASANREPLRTPSIQTPNLDEGAFPWTKALHSTPQHVRQLSVIPDDESYAEDLFSKSGETGSAWFSGSVETPSVSSTIDSPMATSLKSLAIGRPIPGARSMAKVSPMAGSLPINMAKPRHTLTSHSLGLGRLNNVVSKSWSDMWEEDEEEEEQSRREVEKLQELNSRTWSHESKITEAHEAPTGPSDSKPDLDGDFADGFFFQEAVSQNTSAVSDLPRYSPPPKRKTVDKWAALGEKRRAFGGHADVNKTPAKSSRQQYGLGYSSFGAGAWEHYGQNVHTWSNHQKSPRERSKECPWTKGTCGKGRDFSHWRREKHLGLGDVEWVGGWQEAHS